MPGHLYAIGGTLLEANVALPELDPAGEGEPEFFLEILPGSEAPPEQ